MNDDYISRALAWFGRARAPHVHEWDEWGYENSGCTALTSYCRCGAMRERLTATVDGADVLPVWPQTARDTLRNMIVGNVREGQWPTETKS